MAATHVHPRQDERFEVLKGTVGFNLDGQEIVAHAGDRILVPAGRSRRGCSASGWPLGAPLVRLVGYRPTYVPTSLETPEGDAAPA